MAIIELEPVGRRVEVDDGVTLLHAANSAGIEMASVCGGEGVCGKCRVRLMTGALSPITSYEREWLTEQELAAGYRLACQCHALTDAKLDIPPDSLTAHQRLQVEGAALDVKPDPLLRWVDFEIEAPDLYDLRADTARLRAALAAVGVEVLQIPLPMLRDLPGRLRAQGWRGRAVLRSGEVIALLPADAPPVGLAVDIGTTKMAAYLVDLHSGETLAMAGAANPQVAYGEDVISRIAYANTHPDGLHALQKRVIDGLNGLIGELCQQVNIAPDCVVDAVIVGNTAMHHIFVRLPVEQLGRSPYVPAVGEPLNLHAADLGLHLAPGAYVYLPPNLAGYVGADHVAMLLATQADWDDCPTIALDIGTNTEISLIVGDQLFACSCASGPAFEGAHIRDGMRAVPGAIEHLHIHEGAVRVQTIGGQAAIGICGSGILDAVAEMYTAGVLDRSGRIQRRAVGVPDSGTEFLLVQADATGHGRDIRVTRKDVNEIQLAKGAIRAGVEILLSEAGISAEAIMRFIVAGAFGTYLDLANAITIGMFPPLPLDRFRQVGNAAGTGARQMLISRRRRRDALGLIDRARYVELTVHPAFTDTFMVALMFEDAEVG